MARVCHIPRVLLLVDTAGAFGRGIVEGIGRYALENGPWSIQFEYRALDSSPPEWLRQWRGDGIISRTVRMEQMKALAATKLPVVELHGHPRIGLPQVRADIEMGADAVIDHFLNCGLRHFGYFSFGDTWWMKVARDVYCQALERRGFTCHLYHGTVSATVEPPWNARRRPGLARWLRSVPRPIGIRTPGDLHSVRLLEICRELKIAVPADMAVIGIGNDPVICETVRPTLSSLDLNARRIGFEAAALLDGMVAGKPRKEILLVPPSHVAIRQSTDLMAIEDADVARAVQFIREFGCKGVNVDRVAEDVGLSRRALERRFHRYCGRTPKEELIRVRIEHAKTLLARTDQTSESIARKSGFASVVYFTKAFRREVGTTPNAYRMAQRIVRDGNGTSDGP
jgi:LacI family transcriptional regulator